MRSLFLAATLLALPWAWGTAAEAESFERFMARFRAALGGPDGRYRMEEFAADGEAR